MFRSFTTDDAVYAQKAFIFSHQSCDFPTTPTVSTFLIISVHHYCIDRYAHTAYTHTHTQTHAFFIPRDQWGTTFISGSPVFPAVWGLPGSVYLHDTVSSLGVVDDLRYLPVLHWCTIVISRWAKKEKRCLGPRCCFLGHFLQPFRAVMGVWALRCRITKAGNRLILIWVKTDLVHLCNLLHILNTASSNWPLRWHMQCSWHWAGFPQALWTSLWRCSLCRHSWNRCRSAPV